MKATRAAQTRPRVLALALGALGLFAVAGCVVVRPGKEPSTDPTPPRSGSADTQDEQRANKPTSNEPTVPVESP